MRHDAGPKICPLYKDNSTQIVSVTGAPFGGRGNWQIVRFSKQAGAEEDHKGRNPSRKRDAKATVTMQQLSLKKPSVPQKLGYEYPCKGRAGKDT